MKSVSVGLHYFTVMMSVQSHACTGWCPRTVAVGASLVLRMLTTGYSLMECTVVWILRHSVHIHVSLTHVRVSAPNLAPRTRFMSSWLEVGHRDGSAFVDCSNAEGGHVYSIEFILRFDNCHSLFQIMTSVDLQTPALLPGMERSELQNAVPVKAT